MVMNRKTVCAAILFLSCSLPAFAERDGYLLLRYCTATVHQLEGAQVDKDQAADDLSCLVYIAGFTDALKTIFTAKSDSGQPNAGALDGICAPDNKPEASALAFVKYAHEHPESLHLRASDVLALALRQAFPCATGKQQMSK